MTTAKPKRIRKPRITAKHRDARPTIYHPYWAQQIKEHVAQGWSLYRFCQKLEHPHYKTVLKWQAENPEFADILMRAREDGAESHVDRMGYVREQVELGLMDPQAGRVAMQGYRDQAGMIKPRKYGNRVQVEGGGKDGAFTFIISQDDEKLV